MRKTDIAWAAGFFDGEGCITTGTNRGRRQRHLPKLVLGNTSKTSLERLQTLLGGYLRLRRPQAGNRRNLWEWSVSGATATKAVLTTIRPYLFTKATEADVMLELVSGFGTSSRPKLTEAEIARRENCAERLRQLKRPTYDQLVA